MALVEQMDDLRLTSSPKDIKGEDRFKATFDPIGKMAPLESFERGTESTARDIDYSKTLAQIAAGNPEEALATFKMRYSLDDTAEDDVNSLEYFANIQRANLGDTSKIDSIFDATALKEARMALSSAGPSADPSLGFYEQGEKEERRTKPKLPSVTPFDKEKIPKPEEEEEEDDNDDDNIARGGRVGQKLALGDQVSNLFPYASMSYSDLMTLVTDHPSIVSQIGTPTGYSGRTATAHKYILEQGYSREHLEKLARETMESKGTRTPRTPSQKWQDDNRYVPSIGPSTATKVNPTNLATTTTTPAAGSVPESFYGELKEGILTDDLYPSGSITDWGGKQPHGGVKAFETFIGSAPRNMARSISSLTGKGYIGLGTFSKGPFKGASQVQNMFKVGLGTDMYNAIGTAGHAAILNAARERGVPTSQLALPILNTARSLWNTVTNPDFPREANVFDNLSRFADSVGKFIEDPKGAFDSAMERYGNQIEFGTENPVIFHGQGKFGNTVFSKNPASFKEGKPVFNEYSRLSPPAMPGFVSSFFFDTPIRSYVSAAKEAVDLWGGQHGYENREMNSLVGQAQASTHGYLGKVLNHDVGIDAGGYVYIEHDNLSWAYNFLTGEFSGSNTWTGEPDDFNNKPSQGEQIVSMLRDNPEHRAKINKAYEALHFGFGELSGIWGADIDEGKELTPEQEAVMNYYHEIEVARAKNSERDLVTLQKQVITNLADKRGISVEDYQKDLKNAVFAETFKAKSVLPTIEDKRITKARIEQRYGPETQEPFAESLIEGWYHGEIGIESPYFDVMSWVDEALEKEGGEVSPDRKKSTTSFISSMFNIGMGNLPENERGKSWKITDMTLPELVDNWYDNVSEETRNKVTEELNPTVNGVTVPPSIAKQIHNRQFDEENDFPTQQKMTNEQWLEDKRKQGWEIYNEDKKDDPPVSDPSSYTDEDFEGF